MSSSWTWFSLFMKYEIKKFSEKETQVTNMYVLLAINWAAWASTQLK